MHRFSEWHAERLPTSIRPDGKRLRQMREAAGLDIYTVAKRANTTPQAVLAAELGDWCGEALVRRLEDPYAA
jgi:hypothetical protein